MFDYVQSVVYTYLNTQLNDINSKSNSAYPSITYDSSRAITRISNTTKLSRLLFNDDSVQTIAFTNAKNTIISNNVQSILDISQSLYNQVLDVSNIKTDVNNINSGVNQKQPIILEQNPIQSSVIQYSTSSTVQNEINYLRSNLGALQNMLSSKLDSSGGVLMNPTFVGTKTGIDKTTFGLSNVNNTSDINKPISTDLSNALLKKAPTHNPTFTGNVSGITKSMVNLSNVDNTSDLDKPVSIDTSNALALKASLSGCTFTGTVYGITKSMVNLSNVDDTADINKPISNAMNTALSKKAPIVNPVFNGDSYGITKSMVNLSNVDNTSDSTKPISTDLSNALKLKANKAGCTFTGPVYGLTKSTVNLSNVNNIADVDKPISTLEQTALNARMDLSGGTFTGDISTNGNIIFTSSSAKLKYFVAANDAAGKVLMSDANGNLTLQNPTSGGGIGYPTYVKKEISNGGTVNISSNTGSTNWINLTRNGTNSGLALSPGQYLIFYKPSIYLNMPNYTELYITKYELCISTDSNANYATIPPNGINFSINTPQYAGTNPWPVAQNSEGSSIDSKTYNGEQQVVLLNVTTPGTSYYYVFFKCSYYKTGTGNSINLSVTNSTSYIHAIKIS